MPQALAASHRTNCSLLSVSRWACRAQSSVGNSHCRVVTANWVGEIAMAAEVVVVVRSLEISGLVLRSRPDLDRPCADGKL